MHFTGLLKEQFSITSTLEENCDILARALRTGLTIFWNVDNTACLCIDGIEHLLGRNQLVFLTEFHKVQVETINDARILRFNRPFYCINHNSDDDCNGVLFFGAAQVPVIQLPDSEIDNFEILWKLLHKEIESREEMQIDMLRTLLKQFIIYCTRLHQDQNNINPAEKGKLDIVRKFNSLVEMHYKSKHAVTDYADLLNKSPKTLCNLFLQYKQKTPLQVIQERILLEARRLLYYTDKTIKDITYTLGFEDIQTFSRFFKNKEGISPKEFRNSSLQNSEAGKIAKLSGNHA